LDLDGPNVADGIGAGRANADEVTLHDRADGRSLNSDIPAADDIARRRARAADGVGAGIVDHSAFGTAQGCHAGRIGADETAFECVTAFGSEQNRAAAKPGSKSIHDQTANGAVAGGDVERATDV